ncbi:hypothetical protein [Paenibacillus elgii]|uniref:hypothetical protein n=1 Tax=Paenibacillus elgii TaxID=189691 RepID=UPI000FD7EFD7|nr:hypothetical protein [Paenibacillus elgii]
MHEGMYTQQDPIGLAGGFQLYGYVPDPNAWVDVFGLTKGDFCDPVGGTGDAGVSGWLAGKNGEVNWKSRPNFGHTFETHGAVKKT